MIFFCYCYQPTEFGKKKVSVTGYGKAVTNYITETLVR